FFQAEDGIRDATVTGVQTCALPISIPFEAELASILATHRGWFVERFGEPTPDHYIFPWGKPLPSDPLRHATDITWGWDQLRKDKIGRASCRERGEREEMEGSVAEDR